MKELDMKTTRKKQTRNLVPIGTHVPMDTKLTIEALAQSQNKSVYELLQETIVGLAAGYNAQLEALKAASPKAATSNGDDELLG